MNCTSNMWYRSMVWIKNRLTFWSSANHSALEIHRIPEFNEFLDILPNLVAHRPSEVNLILCYSIIPSFWLWIVDIISAFSFSLFLIDNQIHASAALIAPVYVWVTVSGWCVLFWESGKIMLCSKTSDGSLWFLQRLDERERERQPGSLVWYTSLCILLCPCILVWHQHYNFITTWLLGKHYH